jgi:hypothetical protein
VVGDQLDGKLPAGLVHDEGIARRRGQGFLRDQRQLAAIPLRKAVRQAVFAQAHRALVPGDEIITTTNTDCDTYASGRTVIEIAREGAVLGLVKDRRPGTTALGNLKQPTIR